MHLANLISFLRLAGARISDKVERSKVINTDFEWKALMAKPFVPKRLVGLVGLLIC